MGLDELVVAPFDLIAREGAVLLLTAELERVCIRGGGEQREACAGAVGDILQ